MFRQRDLRESSDSKYSGEDEKSKFSFMSCSISFLVLEASFPYSLKSIFSAESNDCFLKSVLMNLYDISSSATKEPVFTSIAKCSSLNINVWTFSLQKASCIKLPDPSLYRLFDFANLIAYCYACFTS